MKPILGIKSAVSVLLIDDDEPLIEVLRIWLGDTRPIRVAHSIREAEEQMAEKLPDYVILDLDLPDSPPSETIKRIRSIKKLAPNTVVIVITGWPDHEREALAGGADGFVSKVEHGLGARLRDEMAYRKK